MSTPPHVLVTGASGFTGQHLVPLLEQRGYRVTGTGHAADHALVQEAMDLTNPAQVEAVVERLQPDYVIHLAALSFVAHPTPEDFYRVNTLGTEYLLSALARQKKPLKKIILASTSNVYGRNPTPVQSETLCPAPVNHYGCSKLAMEHMAGNWFEQLPILITRPFNYTGPGQLPHFLVPKMVQHFADNASAIELGNLDVARDISDVRDICQAYVALLECDGHSQSVNLCSGASIHLRELMDTLCDIAGYQMEIRVNPAFVRASEIPSLRGDRERLEALAGALPTRPVRETLEDMLAVARTQKR
ncbi:epimerase [Marinobacter fuscus]|uniref:Epimerase n=1 Tax=Marinobacter fuscus TaxID=2109942 RepID=A0A2T1KWZ3_9GAMM|nr:NAD-dependent epimerase/dehydratase family protein [Marinobacter fuscus]PSF14293.1 epimerase [Marinobacter fuscus]